MSPAQAAGIGLFFLGVCALMALAALFLHYLHDLAEDRRREKQYADEWQRLHRQRQAADRSFMTHHEGRPE